MDFWEDHMKLSPDYIIKQLELWACNEEKNIEACDSLEHAEASKEWAQFWLWYILTMYCT
ncbi:hypothetical protein PISMIDRAFT_19482 [Pisolithus microcarpus 441]|uniref:Uncharacterized protein n=1 Tax=Pisolithus microcarpus 441 TaxID=765257 RepID=A0A0C9XGS8_9AGAM|nr:hypothetical protein PISMIDRAFT_19482 [Pisolithus microcarpus 441]